MLLHQVPPVTPTRINQLNVLLGKLEKTRIERRQEEQSDEEKMGDCKPKHCCFSNPPLFLPTILGSPVLY
jgi:hypothetical protein